MLSIFAFLGLLLIAFAAPLDEVAVEERALEERAVSGYNNIVVFQHNLHRANHSAPNMTWGTGLATSAKIVAQSCNFAHNMTVNGGGYGQNIAAGIQSTNVSYIISDMFYNSEAPNFNGLYGQAQPSYANFGSWGHFSQVVWKASTKVACYTQYCPKGLKGVSQYVPPYFTVCNYKTPGNYGGQYADQIGKPLNKPTVHWDAWKK